MYLYIETLKQRLDAINQLRVDRALAAMAPSFKQVYSLLPTLLHYHHPLMPGYLDSNVPHGVCFYTPDETQRTYLDELKQYLGALIQEPLKGELPITGVYSMGSTSSVGQSRSSDLDIWVCHQSWLDITERQLLQHKCSLLERWAASLGVTVSFFLIDENRFRHNESGNLGGEDCGSTQHILLLDEFYRTAVRLAGKRILWNMVPCEEEDNYDDYVMRLYAQGVLTPNEWLDLGGLGSLSAEEYFGASLWQLYKSIDSPYKAVLKTLLLEAYSWKYPDNSLLAKDIKQRLHNGEIVAFGLDPYCMMLERVTAYLQAIADDTRLDLVRRCFYLKVCEKLSREQHTCVSWRREVLSGLVKSWGWDEKRLQMLDDRDNWKIDEVRKAHNELLDTMMQSYRHLIRFARRNNLSVSASPQDIGVLTRKLYAAFEALPGKVTLVNPQISPDLSETNLTFIHVPSGRANCAGWYLYNRTPDMESIVSHQPLEYNRYLNKLVAWAWFNGLLTSRTHLFIKGNGIVDLAKLQEMVANVAQHFPLRLPAPLPKALYSPCEIRHLAIIINLEYDPTALFRHHVVHVDFRQLDVFSFGELQQCLIGSIDLLYRNSWNEVRTLHFNGEQAIIEALKTILGKMHQDAAPPEVDVFCYSQHLRGVIRTRVQQIVSECIELRLSSTRQDTGRFKALHVSGQTWGLFFERLHVSVQKLENAIEFYGAISHNKLHDLSVQVGTNPVKLPLVVDGFASEGIIQFFFEDVGNNGGFNIYILDENNRAEVYHHCEGSKEDLVRDVSHFYSSSHDRFTYSTGFINFNLPQFYQIVDVDSHPQVIPFRSQAISTATTSPASQDEYFL
ncbi:class I adenylate cyclase [Enterobacteriaceae bacterium ESL0689]|nr:class I adenylate cyclase [Enterobacteriaceae bacterium ESL0689]